MMITISDTSKNQHKRLDSDNQINLSRLNVIRGLLLSHPLWKSVGSHCGRLLFCWCNLKKRTWITPYTVTEDGDVPSLQILRAKRTNLSSVIRVGIDEHDKHVMEWRKLCYFCSETMSKKIIFNSYHVSHARLLRLLDPKIPLRRVSVMLLYLHLFCWIYYKR